MKRKNFRQIFTALLAVTCLYSNITSVSAIQSSRLDLVDDTGRIDRAAYTAYLEEATSKGHLLPIDIDTVILTNEYDIELKDALNGPQTRSGSFDKLYLACILSRLDGVSTANLVTLEATSLEIKATAAATYPNNSATEDTYRHFCWNYVGSKRTGIENCRLFTTNYEYADRYLDEFSRYYDKQYAYWVSKLGGDTTDAQTVAQAEAEAMLKAKRDECANSINSLADYQLVFTLASMQDFYNNYMGQQASKSYSDMDSAFFSLRSSLATGDNPNAYHQSAGYSSMVWYP